MPEAGASGSGSEYRERAVRYVLDCPLHFRLAPDGTWREGRLRNISVTGLLFEADKYWPAGAASSVRSLEITFPLPAPALGCLSCRADVVREDQEPRAVAARITEYALGRVDERRYMPPQTEDLLWTLARDGSYADAIVVRTDEGAELQYRMDDHCYYTHRYEDGEEEQMLQDALAMRRTLEARGWATAVAG